MQETRLSKMEHEKLAKLFKAQVYYSSYHTSRRGVIIMIRNHIPFEVENTVCDKEGRYVFVVGEDRWRIHYIIKHIQLSEEGPSFIEKIIDLITVQSKGRLGGEKNKMNVLPPLCSLPAASGMSLLTHIVSALFVL